MCLLMVSKINSIPVVIVGYSSITFTVADSDYYDRSTEISEIDARLNRLQQFMKTTMP